MEWAVGLVRLGCIFFLLSCGLVGRIWLFRLDTRLQAFGAFSVRGGGGGLNGWRGDDRRILTCARMLDRTRIPGSVYRPFKRTTNQNAQNYIHELGMNMDTGIGMDGIETGICFILRLSTTGVCGGSVGWVWGRCSGVACGSSVGEGICDEL